MNSRILKKLCKRAAPLLVQLGDGREQFKSDTDECWDASTNYDRKSLKRFRHSIFPLFLKPLKNTIGIGSLSGGYEPEWYDEPAYDALRQLIYMEFTDFNEEGWWVVTRQFHNPTAIFKGAQELINNKMGPIHG